MGLREDLDPFGERQTHPHPIPRHIEHDSRLLAVGGAAIDLGPLLAIAAGEQKGHSRREFALAPLFRDLNIGGVELPIAIGLENTEQIPNDLFLPVDEFKGLSGPGSLGVAKAFYECYRKIGGILVINGVLSFERSGLVFSQLAHGGPPPKWHKK